jgi:hypothetical protein
MASKCTGLAKINCKSNPAAHKPPRAYKSPLNASAVSLPETTGTISNAIRSD